MPDVARRRQYRPSLEAFEKRDVPTLGLTGGAMGAQLFLPRLGQGGLVHIPRSPAEIAARGGDPFAGLPLVSRAALKPGDVLVSTEDGGISSLIRAATGSPYSHAALYIGGGKIIDATSPGVTTRSLADLAEPAARVSVIRAVGLSAAQEQQIVETAKSLLGKKYNTTGLVTGVISEFSPAYQIYRRFWGSGRYGMAGLVGRGYFCSELVIKAYKSAGVKISPESADSPSTIVKYTAERPLEFQLVGRLPVGRT